MPAANDAMNSDDEGHAGSEKEKQRQQESSEVEEQVIEKNVEAGEDEEEEEEEEFEIEAIIEAKRGTFSGGRYGYLVKWKGYGPEHNSWVDENDAGNAQDLIDAYWRKHKKDKKTPRKSTEPKAKATEKVKRKSAVREDSADVTPATKKRGRTSKAAKDASDEEDEDGEISRVQKKPRKSNGTTKKPKKDLVEEVGDELDLGSMDKYMQVPNWENLVETVDTIERDDTTEELFVYFTLKKGGDRIRESAELCGQRFPQKLLRFYESNLRWKTGDD